MKSQRHVPAGALTKFRAAVKAHPNEALAHYFLAEALEELGKPEGSPENRKAMDAASQVVKLDPNLVDARDLLNALYLESGHLDLSVEQSRAGLKLDANDQQAICHLILAMRKAGQKDQIPALLKQLIETRSKDKGDRAASKRYWLY